MKWAAMGSALLVVAILCIQQFDRSGGETDFPVFYSAAQMVDQGSGALLYDAAAQRQWLEQTVGRSRGLFYHPAYELLLFAPLAIFTMRVAYVLWTIFSLACLVATARLLQNRVRVRGGPELLPLYLLIFPPTIICLLQGQDSLLLLLLVAGAYCALRHDRQVLAGLLVALALFKFQLTLPLFLLVSVYRRGRFAAAFLASTAVLGAISLVIGGAGSATGYPHLLSNLAKQPFAGINANAMANLRGLVEAISGRPETGVLLVLSATVLGFAAWRWRQIENEVDFDLAFSLSVVTALLASYHGNPHDLSLLIVPGMILVGRLQKQELHTRVILVALLLLYVPPLHWILLQMRAYVWVAVPVIALFVLVLIESVRAHSRPLATNFAK